MSGLRLAPGLSLPTDAVTEVVGILGARGSGKTTTASVFAEELLKAHLPLVILDPTDAWWGLRSSRDGKSDGYPITILGGEHADAPLEETAGRVLADLVAEEAPPLVLSLRLFSEAAKRRFVADFAERLYEKNRNALHVILDEADEFAPQRIQKGGERLFGAIDRIVRRGRSSGLGVTLISQRSAAISKDVLSQCSTLIAHRASHPRDLEPVLEWMKVHASKEQLAEVHTTIAKLADGEAWVMSPEWLTVFGRFQMRDRTTFNSSATPKAGQRRIVPRGLAPVDLAALEKRIAATIERAKADDPKELRKQIAELVKANAALASKKADRIIEKIDRPALKARDRQTLERVAAKLEASAERLVAATELASSLTKTAADLRAALNPTNAGGVAPALTARTGPARAGRDGDARRDAVLLPPLRNTASTVPGGGKPPSSDLPVGERRVLTAIAQYVAGVSREQLTILTGYKRSSRNTYLDRLRGRGFIEVRGETILATGPGLDALGADFERLPTGDALREHWLTKLPTGERKVLGILCEKFPREVERTVLEEATGYSRSSSNTYLQRLGARQLVIAVGRGSVRASEELFT